MSTTTSITPDATLADLAVSHAGATRVFQRHQLDFCCHGRISMAESCEKRGLDVAALIREIKAEAGARDETFERWDEQPLDVLIEHILDRFHARHRVELPRLVEMARKVERVHRDKTTCPRELAAQLSDVRSALELHMEKEEQIVFPLIRAGQGATAAAPVGVLEQEHEEHGRKLARLRELAHDYVAPAEACTTWRALYLGLAELERDLMEHIHLENNVLFPRALKSAATVLLEGHAVDPEADTREGASRDLYSEAIPAEELAALAEAHRAQCSALDEESIRSCAAEIVRAKTCYCATSQVSIVEALVEDFVKAIRSGPEEGEAG